MKQLTVGQKVNLFKQQSEMLINYMDSLCDYSITVDSLKKGDIIVGIIRCGGGIMPWCGEIEHVTECYNIRIFNVWSHFENIKQIGGDCLKNKIVKICKTHDEAFALERELKRKIKIFRAQNDIENGMTVY
jgi:hypothetical protein